MKRDDAFFRGAIGSWLLNPSYLHFGEVKDYFDGDVKKYAPEGAPAIAGPVVLFVDGNAMMADADNFVRMSPQGIFFAGAASELLDQSTIKLFDLARERGLSKEVTRSLITTALERLKRAVMAALK